MSIFKVCCGAPHSDEEEPHMRPQDKMPENTESAKGEHKKRHKETELWNEPEFKSKMWVTFGVADFQVRQASPELECLLGKLPAGSSLVKVLGSHLRKKVQQGVHELCYSEGAPPYVMLTNVSLKSLDPTTEGPWKATVVLDFSSIEEDLGRNCAEDGIDVDDLIVEAFVNDIVKEDGTASEKFAEKTSEKA